MDFVFGDTTGQAKVSRVHCRCGLRSSIAAKKDPNIAHNDAEDINATHIYFAIRPNVRNMLLPYLSYSLSNDHMSSERIFVEILLNKLEQNLQLGQLHHWATSNGSEMTTSLFAVIHSSQGISNTFHGIIQPFQGINLCFRGTTHLFRRIMHSTICCQRTT